jgi:hypothetical protein
MEWVASVAAQALVTIGLVGSLYLRMRAKFLALDARAQMLCRQLDQTLGHAKQVEGLVAREPRRVRIVINSMPKVGSTSTLVTVATGMPQATIEPFHGITLEMQRILSRVIEEANNDWGRQTTLTHVCRMMEIRPELEGMGKAHPGDTGIYFITGTREPISWALSTLFQLQEVGLVPEEVLQPDAARGAIMEWMHGTPPCAYFPRPEDWFRCELQGYLGVDPMAVGFDIARGFQIYPTQMGPLLIIRNENLDRLPRALAELLAAPPHLFQGARQNVTEEKAKGSLYRQVAATLRFPVAFIEELYSRPYATTFYSAEERQALVIRWSE